MMRRYFRIRLGRQGVLSKDCFANGYVGVDFTLREDFAGKLPDDWRDFNRSWIGTYLQQNPGKTKVAAGLACGSLWTVAKDIQIGDLVLCPDERNNLHIGEVCGPYRYVADSIIPHQRTVNWLPHIIDRSEMSDSLRKSIDGAQTVIRVSSYGAEIDSFIYPSSAAQIAAIDPSIEDPATFAMERHLEDFIVHNWSQTPLGKQFDIYQEDGEFVGRQYQTDTGPIDILAISKDKAELLVVELKRGRASDVVIGQIQRYMGYVQEELTEPGQSVRGIVIALEDDIRIRRALAVAKNIEFYRYEVSFKLSKA